MRSVVLRGLVLVAVVLSVSAAEEAAEPTEPEPVPAEGAAAEEAVPEEPEIVLNCNANGATCRATGQGTTRLRHCLHLRCCLHLRHCLHCLHLRHFRHLRHLWVSLRRHLRHSLRHSLLLLLRRLQLVRVTLPLTGPLARWQSCSTRSRRGASTAWRSGSRTLASVRSTAPPHRPPQPRVQGPACTPRSWASVRGVLG